MYLNVMVIVFTVIAIGAFFACWRMDHASGKKDDEKNIGNVKDSER